MQQSFKSYFLALSAFCLSMVASQTLAKDIGQTLRDNSIESGFHNNYIELGMQAFYGTGPTFSETSDHIAIINIIINGSYQWDDFFIEMHGEDARGLSLGYNAWNSENWSFDILASDSFGQSQYENRLWARQELKHWRDGGNWIVGGRLMGYFGNNMVQFTLQHDATNDHKGNLASLVLGRSWQLRNWNVHSMIGVEFGDEKLNNFFVGVDKRRASYYDLPRYKSGNSISYSAEIGVTYPISEDWVFKAATRVTSLDDSIVDSPFYQTKKSSAVSVRTSINYVF
ncbi:MipA/OmpV family protein [Neptunicella marina]|uniref:MipA/OmpV family protein n=1 Tax=Neptunicella marina TaxID=2125989 RepID=A0A8J6IVP5_9ALTE|nr:MipA/OmpV family protein [Neptunicella marina]MBC3766333.1 MipA/OmpV family protein [Neptunicella marina]